MESRDKIAGASLAPPWPMLPDSVQQRVKKGSTAMFIIAFLPALMAVLGFVSGMPELRPLIAGGLVWSVVLVALGVGVRKGSRFAAWTTFAIVLVASVAGLVHATFGARDARGLIVLGLLAAAAVTGSFRLARDLTWRRAVA